MKPSKTFSAIILAIALAFASAVHSFAIEGLQLSVQSSNVVLSWPSTTDETYIVQSMQAFGTTDTWITLTDYFPATGITNVTYFVNSNAVQFPTPFAVGTNGGSGGGGGGLIPPGGTNGYGGTNYIPGTGFYRVVRDGVHIFGMTNGMVLSGTVQLPIEFAVQSTDEIVGVTFYDTNQNPIIGASASPGPDGGWILTWNTSKSFNGSYSIEAELDFANDDPVMSAPVTVNVNNLISFPNYLTQLYGSQMWVYAQTPPNENVEIDIYDETSAYLGSFFPTSDNNGNISFLWDLTDGEGDTFTDTNFTGVFTLEGSANVEASVSVQPNKPNLQNVSAPSFVRLQKTAARPALKVRSNNNTSTAAMETWEKEKPWKPNNNWVVCYGSITGGVPGDQTGPWAIQGGETSYTEDYGILGTLYEAGANVSPGNSALQGSVFRLGDPISRSNLLSYLASPAPVYENFFYMGHGSDTSISANKSSGITITKDDICFALDNVPLTSVFPTVAGHVYRFVWIEACNNANGSFCEAFGIPAQNLSTNNFLLSGLTSRAYLGYTKEIQFDTDYDGTWRQQSDMWAVFLSQLLHGGASLAALVYFDQHGTGPFASLTFRMDASARTYGATDLIYPNNW